MLVLVCMFQFVLVYVSDDCYCMDYERDDTEVMRNRVVTSVVEY